MIVQDMTMLPTMGFSGFVRGGKERFQPEFADEAEIASEAQWKRDFEEAGDDVIGSIRERIREAKREDRLVNGLTITARNVNYISPRLTTRLSTVTSQLSRLALYFPRFLANKIRPNDDARRYILSDINFTLKEKTMTLLLGTPGAGKSSLCRILANQGVEGKVIGDLKFGSETIHKSDHQHRVAYVRDSDIHIAHLTVRQTFEFADSLLNPPYSKEKQTEKIDAVMKILGLSHRADTIVGNDLVRGVSGGERRRVSIGVELVKRCQLLVLDEATTGLDSTTSLQIFRALRIIADEVAPVFATLKQPGRELCELFDQVIILHEGHIMYVGPPGSMVDHFELQGYELDRSVNPADEVLTLLENRGDEMVERIQHRSNANTNTMSDINNNLSSSSRSDEDDDDNGENNIAALQVAGEFDNNFKNEEIQNPGDQVRYPKYNRNWIIQFVWSVKRSWQEFTNNPGIALGRVIFALLVALFTGTLYLQIPNTQSGMNAMVGAIFIVGTFAAFQAFGAMPSVFATRDVFYYQKRNYYFHPIPFMVADTVTSLPFAIIESAVFGTICYWLIGFNSEIDNFVFFLLIVPTYSLAFQFLAKGLGYMVSTFLVANSFTPSIVFGANFFTGFVITYDRAPDYIRWLFWVSPVRYLFEALFINEFLDRNLDCDDDEEMLPPKDSPLFDMPYEMGGYEGHQVCPTSTGIQLLEYFGFYTDIGYKWYWWLVVIGYMLLAMVFLFLTAMYIEHKPATPRNLVEGQRKKAEQNERVRKLTGPIRSSRFGGDDEVVSAKDSHYSFKDSFLLSGEGKRLETNVPIYLEWRNVCYYVPVTPKDITVKQRLLGLCCSKMAQTELKLLDSVNGYSKPGMLIAFMGPSGAGKTTLLDVLSLRKTAGRMEGQVMVNGAPLDPKVLSRFAGYVEQQNIHVETETVEEALIMSASLRLSFTKENERPISRKEKLEHVGWVMTVLGLREIRHAVVKELSLEQKKRLTIGVELTANPSLLFLDEPTSGLDSVAASRIMKAVKTVADAGVAVVCTLHQPSEILFSWCTHLLLLARGGRVTFFGELTDNCENAIDYFTKFGFEFKEGQNPADFFLDCCSSDKTVEGQTIVDVYQQSQTAYEVDQLLEVGIVPRHPAPDTRSIPRKLLNLLHIGTKEQDTEGSQVKTGTLIPVPVYSSEYATSVLTQLVYLTSRSCRYWWRSPTAVILTIIRSILFGVMLGLLFSEFDDSQRGAGERTGLLYFTILVLSSGASSFVPQVFEERAPFYRETSAKTYREGVYLASLCLSALPIILISFALTTIPAWAIPDLQKGWVQSGYYFSVMLMASLIPYAIALLLCSLSVAPELGNLMVASSNIIAGFTCGFLIARHDIPGYWIWAYWSNYLHYLIEGIFVNEFIGLRFHCHHGEGTLVPVPSLDDPDRTQLYCNIRYGMDYLETSFDYYRPAMPINISVLIGNFIILLALTWFVMTRVRHIQR